MNLLTAFFSLLFLAGIGFLFIKTRSWAKNHEPGTSERNMLLWGSRFLAIAFIISLIATIQSSGIIKISDPFQGQKITNQIPNYGEGPVSDSFVPELKSTPMQPNIDEVRRKHQEQLKEFEQE